MYPLSLSSHPTLNPRYAVALPPPAPSFSFAPLDRSFLRYPVHSRPIFAVHWVTDTGKAHQHEMEDLAGGTTARYVPTYLILVFRARVPCGGAYCWWSGDVILILRGPGIRNFIVGVTVRIASEEINLRRERAYLNKLNLALVQVRDRDFFSPFNPNAIYITECGLGRSSNKNGRTTGQTSYPNSWNRPRRACRCAKTTWSSCGSYQKRFSTTRRNK